MGSTTTRGFDMAEIYAAYCDIVSRNDYRSSRESLAALSKSLESRLETRDAIFHELFNLMSSLELSVDSHHFNCFYNFVFFIVRENGQKNISVCRAITAWRLILTGRFQLLDEWCKFVERHQRHNITEDTWQQLLAFIRCVNDEFEGYDPKGAWPLLIDEFVEHMYSIRSIRCKCDGMKAQPGMFNSYDGGLTSLRTCNKRKFLMGIDASENSVNRWKRFKPSPVVEKLGRWDSDTVCAMEDCLSKGFEGHLSIDCCFQIDQKKVSYT